MKNRWKMNRIGFLNFWLYDEENFEFIDGKLLLRGQNGSGKSITTQSFIPFVLDGDRTPNRLDPFGSSDRRMEYYFLGEEGKEEATGYLFLEFKNEETKEYRTIGIGQRAKRGKPMDFWGFIILDGRRIGKDLWLYKEVGSTRIPYDKREMKMALGENNFFTDSQSEYKKNVNQNIFGFRKEEHYEQFIKLLVKVRAPKLSKEFKPTKVYEILNDSLQTLTDEDLRTMVEAMEKMDEIQDSLDRLNRAFADVKSIRNEYIRYNQYMLAKKAHAYISKKREADTAQKRLDEKKKEKQEIEAEQKEKTQHLVELTEKKKLSETERSGLLDTDMEEIDRKRETEIRNKGEAEEQEKKWEGKIQEYKERIQVGEHKLREIKGRLEKRQQELLGDKKDLDECQEILQWEKHEVAVKIIEAEEYERSAEVTASIDMFRKLVGECKNTIQQYEEIARQYNELAGQIEKLMQKRKKSEANLDAAKEQVVHAVEQWITDIFEMEKRAQQWHPKKEILKEAEQKIRQYRSVDDAGGIQELLREDYEEQRHEMMDEKSNREHERKIQEETLEQIKEELKFVRNQEDIEPERGEDTQISRAALKEAGITAVPFYKTVEFSDGMDEAACARLEAQLECTGILDALVVSPKDFDRIREECPRFLDTIVYAEREGSSDFSDLVVSEELEDNLKETVNRILRNIYEEEGREKGIYLGKNGCFGQGVLIGKADKNGEAEFVGFLARKKRKEQKIRKLEEEISGLTEVILNIENDISRLAERIEKLQEEYQGLPAFLNINAALNHEMECRMELEMIMNDYLEKEAKEQSMAEKKNRQYQIMLKQCKVFPYGRTVKAYERVGDAAEEYRSIWQKVRDGLLQIGTERSSCLQKEEQIEHDGQAMDDAFVEKRSYSIRIKECEIRIQQFDEYLNRPEIVEKANRLKQINEELKAIENESNFIKERLVRLDENLKIILKTEPEQMAKLQQMLTEKNCLKNYFAEELSLKLVLNGENHELFDCAKEAGNMLREGDKNRESADMLNALYQVYQRHNGSLATYGTSLEDCFGEVDGTFGSEENVNVLRKRVRIVSVWNGKKVYLEEFYKILKAAIEETELLIQKKDRELFEDILSQTISRQLTDRIADSRKWVADMSQLMKEMDTSMGLSFSLEWKPRKAETEAELDISELEQILLREYELLTMEDIEKVAVHFKSKIRTEKLRLEEDGGFINYMELIRDALDYRKWFEFRMFFRRGEEPRKPLTNAAFNRFSGGEKAMAMYVSLFAAVNAQYKKAENKEHPRIIALDEAFAGVDDKNISSMFELVHKLDFDYIMNSQALWGCFETVKGLRIAELLRPQNSQVVSVIRYTWNGHERMLDEQ